MHTFPDLAPAKDHKADESGFIHKGGDGFKTQDIAEEWTDGLGERTVKNAESHFHGDAGSDAGTEIDDKDFFEETFQTIPTLVARS